MSTSPHTTSRPEGRSMPRQSDPSATWPPARVFLLISGTCLLLTGLVGLTLDSSFPTSSETMAHSHAHVFGVLETNGWHNLGALALALPALGVALVWPALSRVAALAVGVSNTLVFITFTIWHPSELLIASNPADQIMHAALAVGGVTSAWWRRSNANFR